MLKDINDCLLLQINKFPNLKGRLVKLIDFLFEFRKVAAGNLMRNPAFILHVMRSKVIAKPGTLGFGAVFNPGVLQENGRIIMVAKGQLVPWFKTRGAQRQFYLKGKPTVFLLDQKTHIQEKHIITDILDFPMDERWAIEDTRMFWWKGRKMVNHSLVMIGPVDGVDNQVSVKSALSVLENEAKTFRFCGFPQVDFPVQNFEKNWVYKEWENELLLFYSISPFRVLRLENENNLEFKSIINQPLSSKITNPGGFGTMVSFSANPVDFDENYWLMIVHQIDNKISGRCYYHWAVLINKATVIPERMSSKPVFSGMGARGRTPGVRYISSVLRVGDEILFFAGEGDVHVTVTRKPVKTIIKDMVDL
ncbi:hypothetical protein CBW16_03630 [Flavobacteriaceae bacterium JJC]|nr:hypothetical protein CBW16_03630 [Flavobacteriaceae bacterium JJC]